MIVTTDYTMLGQTGFSLLTQTRGGSKIVIKKIFYSKNLILFAILIKGQEIKEIEGMSIRKNLFSLLRSVL